MVLKSFRHIFEGPKNVVVNLQKSFASVARSMLQMEWCRVEEALLTSLGFSKWHQLWYADALAQIKSHWVWKMRSIWRVVIFCARLPA